MTKITDIILSDVEKGEIARFLYKYRPIDKILETIIKDGSLWFADAPSFNDPFDCQIQVDTQNTVAEIKDFIKKNSPKIDSQHLNQIVGKIMADPDYWPRITRNAISKNINAKGICCFSSHNESVLMWSHYTNCHRGVSLKFDVTLDPSFFTLPIKVEYTNNYPKYNHIRNQSNLVKFLIQSKSKIWEYEDEIRVLKNEVGAHIFNKNCLVEVTFGCNCDKKEMKRVREIFLKNGYDNTIFTKASVSKSKYKLEFTNIS